MQSDRTLPQYPNAIIRSTVSRDSCAFKKRAKSGGAALVWSGEGFWPSLGVGYSLERVISRWIPDGRPRVDVDRFRVPGMQQV